MTASYVIPVRQASALPAASFRFHLAMDTLAVQLVVPPTGSTGDFHSLKDAPCRAHKEKGRGYMPPALCSVTVRILAIFEATFKGAAAHTFDFCVGSRVFPLNFLRVTQYCVPYHPG